MHLSSSWDLSTEAYIEGNNPVSARIVACCNDAGLSTEVTSLFTAPVPFVCFRWASALSG